MVCPSIPVFRINSFFYSRYSHPFAFFALIQLSGKFFLFSFFLLLFSFFFSSCRKSDRDTDTTTDMVSDNAQALYYFNDVYRQFHQFALSDSNLNSTGSYALIDTLCIDTVTHSNSPGTFPDTVTIAYGNNLACADGNRRSGKIKMIFSGKYGGYLKSYTINPENYYLGDYNVAGKINVSCRGTNSSGFLYFVATISNGSINNDSLRQEFFAPANGQTSGIQYEWTAGSTTPDINDDVFRLTGTYGGIATKGTTYNCEISSSLQCPASCKWVSSGKEILTPQNLSPRETDYGSGCDNKATVKINGKEIDVTLLP